MSDERTETEPPATTADQSATTYTLLGSTTPPVTITHSAALKINFIKNLLDDQTLDPSTEIPISEVSSPILTLVVNFCEYMDGKIVTSENIEMIDKWEREFLDIDHATLFQLILAANYLDVQSLLDLCCKHVADIIKGKSAEEIRSEFRVDDDFLRKIQRQ